jgi:hypothetical protein
MDEQQSVSAPSFRGDQVEPRAGDISPLDLILRTTGGYCVARALHVAADLGVADCIGDKPALVGEIAALTGSHADSLGRLLRLLSAHGIFCFNDDCVSHSNASRTLRSDHPQSTRDLARMFGVPVFWETFAALDHTARTGRPAIEKVHPEGLWAWLSDHPEASAVFNGAMIGKSYGQVAGVVASYDFSPFGRIADVGGGRGHLLEAILAKWPAAKGILFEQPHVIAEVDSLASDRLELRAGDFFTDKLPVCDAYILMEVIHDWRDEDSLRILSAVSDSAPKGSKLLLVEQLMPTTPGPHWVKMLDVHMMALFAARQRTADEYDCLVEQCRFKRIGARDTPAGISILEYERD